MRLVRNSLLIVFLSWCLPCVGEAATELEDHSSVGLLDGGVGILVMGRNPEARAIEAYAESILKAKGVKVMPQGTTSIDRNVYILITGRDRPAYDVPDIKGGPHDYKITIELRASAGGPVHHSLWAMSVMWLTVVPPKERPTPSEFKHDLRYLLEECVAKFSSKK